MQGEVQGEWKERAERMARAPHTFDFLSPPSSKCLHLLITSWCLCLQPEHSRRSTTFLVVLAFLWKTGLVWPP